MGLIIKISERYFKNAGPADERVSAAERERDRERERERGREKERERRRE